MQKEKAKAWIADLAQTTNKSYETMEKMKAVARSKGVQ